MNKVICLSRRQLNYTRTLIPFDTRSNGKGGSVRFLDGFTWLPIDKKAFNFPSMNLRVFFPRIVFLPNET